MHFPKVEQYLNEVITCVKFRSDRETIKAELESHLLDKIDDYITMGYDNETAEQLSIKEMGDARELGKALNKEHNPVLGWILSITNILIVLLIAWIVLFNGSLLFSSFTDNNLVKDIPVSDIAYQINLKETVKLDDMVINFTDIIYEKDGTLNVFYNYYDTKRWGTGWSFGGGFTISDNLGNTSFDGGSQGKGGIKSYYRSFYNNFSSNAEILYISYDMYNRSFQLKIPLKVGENDD